MTATPPARTVLVVEDEPVIRMITRAALTGAGFAITEAGDGETARAAVKTGRSFDLILLDLTLPDTDGVDLIPDLRRGSPGSRIVVVSGSVTDGDTDLAVDGLLAKPFTKAKLLEVIHRTLART